MVRIPTHREPTLPGEMLLEEFLDPMGLNAIGVPYQRVNEIVNRRRGVTPSTALRLGHEPNRRKACEPSFQHAFAAGTDEVVGSRLAGVRSCQERTRT